MINTLLTEKTDALFEDLLTDEELITLQQIFKRNKESNRRSSSLNDVDRSWEYRERKEKLVNLAYKEGEKTRMEIERELISKHIREEVTFIPIRHAIVESMTSDVISARMSITHFRNGTIPMGEGHKMLENEYYDRFEKLSDDGKLKFAERQLKLLDISRLHKLSKDLLKEELTAVYKEIVGLISKRDDHTDRYFEDNAFRALERAAKK